MRGQIRGEDEGSNSGWGVLKTEKGRRSGERGEGIRGS
jgi:hypothetical protein